MQYATENLVFTFVFENDDRTCEVSAPANDQVRLFLKTNADRYLDR